MTRLPKDWEALLTEHEAAVSEYCRAVRQLPPHCWHQPLAPGKWSAGEVTSHLCEAYLLLRGELAGRPGMRIVVPQPRRWVLKHFLLPRLLRRGRFLRAVRAPRETRPRQAAPDPERGLEALLEHAAGFGRELTEQAGRGRVRLTHAYFGSLDAREALRLCVVHTRHHARQVAGALRAPDRSAPVEAGDPGSRS